MTTSAPSPIKQVRVACNVADTLPLDELTPFQGELKSLSSVDYAKLKRAIVETGFAFPVYVWRGEDGENFIIGGHQRVRVLKQLRDAEGYLIPPVPVVYVEAADLAEAKRRVLQDVAQYGKIESQGLYEFMTEAGLSIADLGEQFRLPDINIGDFGNEFFRDELGNPDVGDEVDGDEDGEGSDDEGGAGAAETLSLYSSKITVPIYEPKGERPEISALVDMTKADQLAGEISRADIPEDVREFLIQAAIRHAVFDYEKIAEYYAHAEAPVQRLMEKLALVIIDFNLAIENGFVVLSEKLAEAYRAEVEAEEPEDEPAPTDA